MAFSRCGSYRKDTCYHDEYIAIQYMLNKFEGRMTAFNMRGYAILLLTQVIYVIQCDDTT